MAKKVLMLEEPERLCVVKNRENGSMCSCGRYAVALCNGRYLCYDHYLSYVKKKFPLHYDKAKEMCDEILFKRNINIFKQLEK